MSEKQQSGNGNEVVLEVESEEIVNEAKVDYLPVSTESSTSGYHSSDNISRFSNVPIPNETSLSRSKSSNSLGQQSKRTDSDIVGDSNLEQDITSPDNKSAYTDDDDEEEEEIYKKVNLIKKVKYKKMMEWIVFLCSLGVLVASFTVEKLENFKVWGLEIWKWCVLAMLLFCGMLITNCVVHILVFLIEKNILFRKKVLYFVHLMKKSVQVFVWWGLVLLTWLLLFNRRIERSKTLANLSDHITGTLVALLIGALLWLLTKLLFRILASKYMETYRNRIERCLSYKRVIETLSGPPLKGPPLVNKSPTLTPQMVWEGKRGHWKGKEVIGRAKRSLTPQMVSVETMDTLVDAISWNIRLPRNKGIYSEKDAEAAASHIFRKVAKRGFKYVEEEDLMRFMSEDEAELVFMEFEEAAKTGKITRNDLELWMVKIYRDRKSLMLSINDAKHVVKQFDQFFSSTVIVITIIVWLLLARIVSADLIVFLSTQFLVAAFVFGNICKNVFESVVFLFVTHPFDVGDRLVVDGVQMVVDEMNILTTTFLKANNEMVYFPNSVLSTKTISNFYRSPDMGDTVEFSIVLTPVEKIDMLRKKLKEYLESKSKYWRPDHDVVVIDIEDVNKLKMALYVHHTMNFQEFGEKNKRRTELVIELMRILEDLNITYNLLPQQVQLPQTKADATVSFKR